MAADWGHDGEVRQMTWSAEIGVRKSHTVKCGRFSDG